MRFRVFSFIKTGLSVNIAKKSLTIPKLTQNPASNNQNNTSHSNQNNQNNTSHSNQNNQNNTSHSNQNNQNNQIFLGTCLRHV